MSQRITPGYVLVIDDDPDARDILSRVVRSVGLQTRTASDGLEALDALRNAGHHPPVMVLLDLIMPGMDGFSVFKWLRGNPATRYTPVIVVTACERSQVDMLRLPGVAEVVQKSDFSVSKLGALIEEQLAVTRI